MATKPTTEPTEPTTPPEAPAKPIKQQGKDGAYYIVNPAGAVHGVTREHARGRLATAGWRMATEDEIATYQSQEIQRHDRPIAAPWSPDPDAQLAEID
jgi:hypothetical protein